MPPTRRSWLPGSRAVVELGAEALILACGGMAQAEAIVRERVGVPATNGVAFGALLALALWRAGLRTSQVGSLASRPCAGRVCARRNRRSRLSMFAATFREYGGPR